jgi:probable HAF family extracellular repeat protein
MNGNSAPADRKEARIMSTIRHRVARTGVIAVAAGMAAMTVTPALASPAAASAGNMRAAPDVSYTFKKLDNASDPTFNQLLGINNHRKIVGFYGSGAPGHPNRGYRLVRPYRQADYRSENFPGSAQAEVTGINDSGVSVGTFVNASGAHVGFYLQNGRYHRVAFSASSRFSELLGINNAGIAVGDYQDSFGSWHAYRYSIVTHRSTKINVRNSADVTATGINAGGTIVGFFTTATGSVDAFLRHPKGSVTIFAKHNADMTQAFGINKAGVVVGAYTSLSATIGFTWTPGQFHAVNDPNGVGFTVVKGINNAGDLVGFYTDSRGNTNGFLATP